MCCVVATDELARHSPGSLRRGRRRVVTGGEAAIDSRSIGGSCSSISDLDTEAAAHGACGAENSHIGLMKSMSDISCKKPAPEVSWKLVNPEDTVVASGDGNADSRNGRNSNSPTSACVYKYC